jgi:hypothetical protein
MRMKNVELEVKLEGSGHVRIARHSKVYSF